MTEPADPVAQLRVWLRTRRDLAAQSEEITRQGIENARAIYASDREHFGALGQVWGLTDGILDVLAASARQVTAAEALFAVAVEAREALDKMLRELE